MMRVVGIQVGRGYTLVTYQHGAHLHTEAAARRAELELGAERAKPVEWVCPKGGSDGARGEPGYR